MKTHPDKVLETLIEKKPRARAKLAIIHEVCREIYDSPGESGRKDYSLATVGRKTQERNGPSLNTMYSPLGVHFRELLAAWAEWDGMDTKKPALPVSPRSGVEDLLSKIPDSALRSLIGFELARGRQALAELNTLKGQTTFTIDTRPADGSALARTQECQVIAQKEALLPTELAALTKACNEEWLQKIGFLIGPEKSVKWRTRRGVAETVLPIGFLSGLRKLIN